MTEPLSSSCKWVDLSAGDILWVPFGTLMWLIAWESNDKPACMIFMPYFAKELFPDPDPQDSEDSKASWKKNIDDISEFITEKKKKQT